MNTAVPWSGRGDGARDAASSATRDWLDDLVGAGARAPVPADAGDHGAAMEAIAAQIARMEAPGRRGGERLGGRAALRDAVAQIARRQADLDDEPIPRASSEPAATGEGDAALPAHPAEAGEDGAARSRRPAGWVSPETVAGSSAVLGAGALDGLSARATAPVGMEPSGTAAGRAIPASAPERSGLGRAGIDLSAEVSQTFARFSRDMLDAIHAADVRPEIQALDRQVRHIGRAVDGLGTSLPPSRAGSPPEGPAGAPGLEVAGTLADMRGLLDTFKPGATIASLESRLDDLANRIERGHADPTTLIEGLSRRVDEIHTSLRSQMAQSTVDTGPLEDLVRGISDRIGQARESSSEFGQLETAMRDAAARIDRVPRAADERGIQGLEGQIARIGERLDRSEANFRSLDGVEHSLGELFSQFEVTRQVAVDAAETAARTAARDTLRAALQNPNLQPRPAEMAPALADQMARGIDDLRAMQEIAQRRTQDALSQIHDAMERLARHMSATEGARSPATPGREARRSDVDRARTGDAPTRTVDRGRNAPLVDADTPLEPGFGRTGPELTEPRFEPDSTTPLEPTVAHVPGAADGDGPASFIAAARRAAQAAQASAASAAALKAGERRTDSVRSRPAATGLGALDRVKAFLAQRRRPLLLGVAALVMLVGALEVVNLGVGAPARAPAAVAETAPMERPQTRVADVPAPHAAAAAKPTTSSPVAAPAAPSLPTFAAGATRLPAAAASGIADGLRSLAVSGDAAAQYEVGLRYAEARGVTRDPKEGLVWFQKAAAQGLAPAEYRLGSAYEKGVGTDRDPVLAMTWYGKAAEAGNIKAMHNLAVMAAEGAAGKPDYAKAAQWFQKASAYGVRDSQFNLAILYARGLGIEQSLTKSYTWFAIAASAGDDDAGKKRDEVAQKLDATALASAKAAVEAYRPATPPSAANEVAPPLGGWDAVAPRASAGTGAKVSRL